VAEEKRQKDKEEGKKSNDNLLKNKMLQAII
jgi:hypothetical protein